jgi:tRNA-dihydrouridine synthase B
MKSLKIGNVKIKNPLFLAPMVEVTNLPYRLMCKKAGAGMTYTEMIYLDAILHENEKTLKMMLTSIEDKPIGLQVTGDNPEEFSRLIPYTKPYSLVDINCGCPSTRIIGTKAGSYLLQNPEKIVKMIKILKEVDLTVTAKIRLGFNKNNVLKIAKEIEKAGADALTVHARLATQGNNIPADWKEIKKVKDSLGIPVIGNGDINSPQKALEMLEIADGAMIGRAAIGDPLIFKRTLNYLKTGKQQQINQKENLKLFIKYLELSKKYECDEIGKIKYVGSNFFKGFVGASRARNELMQLKSIKELKIFSKNIAKDFQ